MKMTDSLTLTKTFHKQFPFSFNTLLVGRTFAKQIPSLLIGTIDGRVRILDQQQTNSSEGHSLSLEESTLPLETKGGAIQALYLHDITRLGTIDLIVGDSEGNTILFSKGEILNKTNVGAPVTAVTVDRSSNNIVAGDASGTLSAFGPPSEHYWKVRVNDTATQIASQTSMSGSSYSKNPAIRSLLATVLPDKFGVLTHVLLVSDGSHFIHFYAGSARIFSLPMPSQVNCIISGHFRIDNGDEMETDNPVKKMKRRVVAGCEDGYIYLIEDYQATRLISVGYPVTHLVAYNSSASSKDKEANPMNDLLLCTGHFNSLHVYDNKKLIASQKTSDWIHTLSVGDIDNDDRNEIVIGMMDNSVEVFKLS